MALVLLRVAGNMAKRLENQGNKGYSLGIWSWRQLLEGAESPNTAGFPRLVEQARWGGKGSWEVSPAGLLCSVLGLFCVLFFRPGDGTVLLHRPLQRSVVWNGLISG